ncbi:MAG: SDR family oxidoreductase [Bacteroidales bacterium]|nr:SDR family oxidoreductase [Bacteroidales bacterium]
MNKTALITGASSGIGLELVKIHARHGDNLVLVARNKVKLNELKNEIEKAHKVTVHLIVKDLSVKDAALEVFNEVQSQGISIDYLINNAGFGHLGAFVGNPWEKEEQMIQLNITALVHLTKLFLPEMIARESGKIMNVGSVASFMPGPFMAVYYATKAFVLSFSEAINNEVRDKGVSVTALCPGPTESGFQDVADMKGIKLVEKFKMPSSKEVAEFGYKAMMKGKPVAIHGVLNRMMVASLRISPRSMVVKSVRWIQGK